MDRVSGARASAAARGGVCVVGGAGPIKGKGREGFYVPERDKRAAYRTVHDDELVVLLDERAIVGLEDLACDYQIVARRQFFEG